MFLIFGKHSDLTRSVTSFGHSYLFKDLIKGFEQRSDLTGSLECMVETSHSGNRMEVDERTVAAIKRRDSGLGRAQGSRVRAFHAGNLDSISGTAWSLGHHWEQSLSSVTRKPP